MDSNILTAIDDTIQQRPNGYFADKLHALFDKDDAPLNPKAEHFVNTVYALKEFYKKVLLAGKAVTEVEKESTKVAKRLGFAFKKIEKASTAFELLNKAIGGYIGALKASSKKISGGKIGKPIVNITFEPKTIVDKLTDILNAINSHAIRFFLAFPIFTKATITLQTNMVTHLANIARLVEIIRLENRIANTERLLTPASTTTTNNTRSTVNNMPNRKGAVQSIVEYIQNTRNDGEGSLIGSIIGFIVKAGLVLTGLSFLKKWLDTSETGKKVKEVIKNLFHNLSKAIGDWIEAGNLKTILKDGTQLIVDTLSFLFSGVFNFFKRHEDKIGQAVSSSWDVVWNDVLVPLWTWLWGSVKESFKKNLEKQQKKSGNDSLLDKILDPIVAVFKSSVPILLTWMTLRVFPIVGSLVIKPFEWIVKNIIVRPLWGALSKIVAFIGTRFIGVLTMLMTRVVAALGPIGAIAVVGGLAVVQLTRLAAQYQEMNQIQSDINDHSNKILDGMKKREERNKDRLAQLKANEKLDPTRENFLLRKVLEVNMAKAKLDEQETEKRNKLNESWFKWGAKEALSKEYADKQAALAEKSGVVKLEQELRKIHEERAKKEGKTLEQIQDEAFNRKPASKPIGMNDGIIIQPHTKDQVLMTKKDGPIDLMLRDMTMKFDQMMQIMAAGLGTVASTTNQSGNNIVQAVLATGGSGKSGNNNDAFAGSDPIRDHRDRALRAFSYAQ